MRKPRPMPEDAKEQLYELLKQSKSKADFQRIQCLWLRAALDLSASAIAVAVAWNENHVRRVQSEYFRKGSSALIGAGRGGRHKQNLTQEQENELLAPYFEKAESGGILVVSEIKADYEKEFGSKVPKSTVYRMLKRHGWRKLAPRSKHPKSDKSKQEEFKKNSR